MVDNCETAPRSKTKEITKRKRWFSAEPLFTCAEHVPASGFTQITNKNKKIQERKKVSPFRYNSYVCCKAKDGKLMQDSFWLRISQPSIISWFVWLWCIETMLVSLKWDSHPHCWQCAPICDRPPYVNLYHMLSISNINTPSCLACVCSAAWQGNSVHDTHGTLHFLGAVLYTAAYFLRCFSVYASASSSSLIWHRKNNFHAASASYVFQSMR